MTVAGPHILDNPIWHALGSHQAPFRIADGRVRRFDPEVAPFSAGETDADLAHLADAVPEGGAAALFTTGPIALPPGFDAVISRPLQMSAEPLRPGAVTHEFIPLEAAHVPEMLALVELTKPGPFAPRTIELGGYVGLVEDGRLVAMAGERLHPPGFAEISAVCTHPDVRGRGLAKQLVLAVAAKIVARDETPFLHVWPDNAPAIASYEAVGFAPRRMMHVTFVRRVAG